MTAPRRQRGQAGVRSFLLQVLSLGISALATSACADELPRLAFAPSSGSTASANDLQRALAARLATINGLDVVSSEAVATALGPEGLATVEACPETQASCVAEAMARSGANLVLLGIASSSGEIRQSSLRLVRVRDGKVIWHDGTLLGEPSEFMTQLTAAITAALAEQPPAGSRPSLPAAAAEARASPAQPLIAPPNAAGKVATISVGGLLLAVGAGFSIAAAVSWADLQSTAWRAAHHWPALRDQTNAFNQNIVLGVSLASAGAAVGIAGLLWAFITRNGAPTVLTFAPRLDGVQVRVTW